MRTLIRLWSETWAHIRWHAYEPQGYCARWAPEGSQDPSIGWLACPWCHRRYECSWYEKGNNG